MLFQSLSDEREVDEVFRNLNIEEEIYLWNVEKDFVSNWTRIEKKEKSEPLYIGKQNQTSTKYFDQQVAHWLCVNYKPKKMVHRFALVESGSWTVLKISLLSLKLKSFKLEIVMELLTKLIKSHKFIKMLGILTNSFVKQNHHTRVPKHSLVNYLFFN